MSDLTTSYAWCRQVCKQSQSSFFSSFALLDPARRRAMYALYAFSRISDDLSDSQSPVEQRATDLQRWSALLGQLPDVHCTADPTLLQYALVWPALSDSINRFDIPTQLLKDIVHGVMMDLQTQQAEDWPKLREYCYHVASAVGLACVYIWRSTDEIPTQPASDCGIAFQLTNILRDIAEDAKMGRIYLPKNLFAKYGISPDSWLAGQPTGDWKALIREVADTAYRHYASGWQTIHALTPRSQRMFSLMWRSYRTLLDDVVGQSDNLWEPEKIRISNVRKTFLLVTHFFAPLYASLPEPCLKAY